MPTLPSNAQLFARPDVWMETAALDQLAAVASRPGCLRAAGMPDLHPGRGIPVGAAFAFRDELHPELVGGDAGCGARIFFTRERRVALDALERRLPALMRREGIGAPDGADPARLLADVLYEGPAGLARADIPDPLAWACALAAREGAPGEPLGEEGAPARAAPSAWLDGVGVEALALLGTIGGGNHFAELARVDEIRDPAAAEALGARKGHLAVLVHSGSRGLGASLAARWPRGPLSGDEAAAYAASLAGAVRFARVNRLVLAARLLGALGVKERDVSGTFDVVHNTITREPTSAPGEAGAASAWIHRKGAAPARAGQPTLVLGSRGAPSWVLRGLGSAGGLCSVAHGAGRKMHRSEAREKLKARYARAELARTRIGSRVLCEDPELLYEEHPDAYKKIEPVVASVEEGGLAAPVASLTPLLTLKL